MRKFIAIALLMAFSLNANALSILLSGGHRERDVTDRLISLGHTVTEANAAWYGSEWDYSPYDVVAFQYGTNNPADVSRLVDAVENEEVGVVFFRAWGADEIAQGLGISAGDFDWQAAEYGAGIVDNNHYITDGLTTGIKDLGLTYMTVVNNPGVNTSTLVQGPDGAALVVHNELRVAISPYYYPDENETALSIELTERTLQWAAGASVVPIPAAVWLFGSALAGLGWIRKKQAL